MDLAFLYQVGIEATRSVAIEEVLQSLVSGLCEDERIALARIWLSSHWLEQLPGVARRETPADHLRLVVSQGNSLLLNDWSQIEGEFALIRLGERGVGRIAAQGRGVIEEARAFADADWVMDEEIRTFMGQPLIWRGEVIGVLALFHRERLEEGALTRLGLLAQQAAMLLGHGRDFAELQRLRDQLAQENRALRQREAREGRAHGVADLIGQSGAMERVRRQIRMVAPLDTAVLIEGETGTGKELVARAIHQESGRSGPFVAVNVSAIPAELFASEFFGHRKGAFTGAVSDHPGFFAQAQQGTLFLDEIGELDAALQTTLLRVLQEQRYRPVGGTSEQRTDARVIAATHQNLFGNEHFREDLYYRLATFPLHVPPLRERGEDLEELAAHLLARIARRHGLRRVPALDGAAREALRARRWPGNVRELENALERALILGHGEQLVFDDASPTMTSSVKARAPGEAPDAVVSDAQMKQRRLENVQRALDLCEGRIHGPDGAAALLGMPGTTLASMVRRHALDT